MSVKELTPQFVSAVKWCSCGGDALPLPHPLLPLGSGVLRTGELALHCLLGAVLGTAGPLLFLDSTVELVSALPLHHLQ